MHDEGLVAGRLHRAVGERSHASRAVCGDELLDVVGLRELDLAVLGLRDLDVEEIGDGALVLDLATSTSCLVKE